MLNSEEILNLLQNCPQGYLKPEHEMFTATNFNLLPTYKKLGAISCKEDEVLNKSLTNSSHEIFCNAFGCSVVFDNISSYQSHYNVMHRFICAECKKSLPTEHFLDLHITDHHDSYFKARVEKGERLFKCYLEECKELFGNPLERREHCIKRHKFPSNFRFDQIHNKTQHKDKIFKNNSDGNSMEVVEELKPNKYINRELKMFSFGHQKEKTFCPRNSHKQKQETGEILENMDTLKQALESM